MTMTEENMLMPKWAIVLEEIEESKKHKGDSNGNKADNA
jgi:hypothetical protein